MSNSDDIMVQGLRRIANTMNQINKVKSDTDYFYDVMTEGIVWHDELPPPNERRSENFWGLRPIFRYRASLLLGTPDFRWERHWELAQRLFPKWVGFLAHRSTPTPEVVQFLKANIKQTEEDVKEFG